MQHTVYSKQNLASVQCKHWSPPVTARSAPWCYSEPQNVVQAKSVADGGSVHK